MDTHSLHHILVRIPNTYRQTIKCGKLDLYIDTRFNDVRYTVRHGEIISSPDQRFQKGDIIYFHHNITRRIRTMSGIEKEATESVLNDIFPVPPDQIYGIKRNGTFSAVDPYCFIKPMPNETQEKNGIKIISNNLEKPQYGIVRYGNKSLEQQEVKEGDTIIFNKNSEYEYPIDNEKLYRMQTDWIIAHVRP